MVNIAVKARKEHYLRHVPLFMIVELERQFKTHNAKHLIAGAIYEICDRPDQMTEFLALYWRDKKINGKKNPPLTAQIKKGLAKAFTAVI